MDMSSADGPHVLVFPYPAPGHIIPFLDLLRLFLDRRLILTVVITPSQLPLLHPLLSHPSSSIRPLILSPPDIPPSSSLPRPLLNMRALSHLSGDILRWFRSHPSPPVAIVSDMFLGWTNDLAADLGVPRLVFYTSGACPVSVFNSLWTELPAADDSLVVSLPTVPNCPKYPWWQITHLYSGFKRGDPDWEFLRNSMLGNVRSWGAVVNSFTDLEGVYIDHMKKEMGHDRVWAVGPLLPADDDLAGRAKRGGSSSVPTRDVLGWLDSQEEKSVVYVCFGSRWTLTNPQIKALAAAIQCSRVHFIWVLKEADEIPDGFENRVEGRGLVIKGWAPQVAILRHRAVAAFVSHCGWNSTLEALSAGVLMLAWPLAADQFSTAKLLVEELGVAVKFCGNGNRTAPDAAEIGGLLAEAVGGGRPERSKVAELQKAAAEAPRGGSSSRDLEEMVEQLRRLGGSVHNI